MVRTARVALLIESSRCVGREILKGISSYMKTHDCWSIFHHERNLHDPAPRRLAAWKPDGIIARIGSSKLIQQIKRWGIPTVDVLGWHPVNGVPRFGSDRRKVVEVAIEHLRGRGLTELAYCGFAGLDFSDVRGTLFVEQAVRRGLRAQSYKEPRRSHAQLAILETERQFQPRRLAGWLESLPKPVGLFACNDMCARQVLNACQEADIKVPDEIAVLGVDNDEVLCELSDPPLSSIQLNNETIGYEAAALLERMLRGAKAVGKEFRFSPRRVVARRSSETLAISDRDVADALRLIREQACRGLTVAEVLDRVGMSASTLKRRFAAILQRSPKAEIHRVQLERAKELLATGNLPLARVAELAGFANVEWFSKLFHRKTGYPPGQYRRTVQSQTES